MEWLPREWNFENFEKVWTGKNPFITYYLNSMKITGLTVLGSLITSSLAGFAFAKINFAGRNLVFLMYLATSIIPGQVLLVPRFVLFDNLGLINTHLALILPGESGLIDEFLVENTYRNPEGNPLIFDTILLERVVNEPNIWIC